MATTFNIHTFPASNRRQQVIIGGGQRIESESEGESEYSPTKSDIPVKPLSHPTEDPNLVQWDGPNDPQNPQNWPARRKWLITIVAVLTTVNVCVLISHSS